jgi:CBS domain-containing protein
METPVSDTIAAILLSKGHDVWSVSPSTSVYRAIEVMADKSVGALLVVDNHGLVGIISERDYTRKIVLQGKSSRETRVQEIMTSPVMFVTPEHSVDDCMRIMSVNRVRHLPVLDGENVVGVVSIGDVVNRLISAQQEAISHLQAYITGKYPG